jgi:hypothetical protein
VEVVLPLTPAYCEGAGPMKKKKEQMAEKENEQQVESKPINQ